MRTRRVLALSVGLAITVQLGLTAGPAAPAASAAPRPPGAADHAPAQARGAVDRLPAAAPTAATQHGRLPARRAGGTALTQVPRRDSRPAARHPVTKALPGKRIGYDARTSAEQAGSRRATSTVFANADGTRTVRIYSAPAYVRDGTGYAPLDLTLHRSGNRYAPVRGAGSDFAAAGGDPVLASVAIDGSHSVGYGLAGASGVPAVASGPWLRYANIRPHADLRLAGTANGATDEIVLTSPAAPTSYTFPLRLAGLTPSAGADGGIVLRDNAGSLRATIPAGWMSDGVTSHGVRYTLLGNRSGGWSLRVDLDAAWLRDAHRRFPVTVDPAITLNTNPDDTYVQSGSAGDNSGSLELRAGTVDGGATRAGSFLHFDNLATQLANQAVLGASLAVVNGFSPSCTAKPVDLYAVRQPWSGASTTTWPGPALGDKLSTQSFAFGASGCAARRVSFPINPDVVSRWTHGTPFYGFSLQASATDSGAWKKFTSANDPITANIPFLDITYAAQGAGYHADVVNPPLANAPYPSLVTVTNLGSSTWPAGGAFKLGYLIQQNGTTVSTQVFKASPPRAVPPNGHAQFTVTLPALNPGTYTVLWDMFDASNRSFHATYSTPYGSSPLKVDNATPQPTYEQPASGSQVDSLTPTLYAEAVDPDNFPGTGLRYGFRTCDGPTMATATCFDSGMRDSRTYQVPAGRLLWSHTYYWWVQVSDGQKVSAMDYPGLAITPTVPQPEITSHLDGNLDSAEAPGVDVQVGNYSLQATDADIDTVGPDLTITRTYNSLSPGVSAAFGPGWSSRLDTSARTADDGSQAVLVTLPTGEQVRFGRNADGSYAAPAGRRLSLSLNQFSSRYLLRDATGTTYTFGTSSGKLVSIADIAGRTETLIYGAVTGRLARIVNDTSGRSLRVSWLDSGRISNISSDPLDAGGDAQVWGYGYDTSGTLATVCGPGAGNACTHYSYVSGSHYPSVVADDNPAAYWRLGEASGSTAVNAAAHDSGAGAGTYSNVTLGAAGATASPDRAATFNGTSSLVALPGRLATSSLSMAAELWFQTTSVGGVLLSYQNKPFPSQTPTHYTPILYIGADGLLRGGFWSSAGTSHVASQAPVNDGTWHHAVISASVDSQTLYLDGVSQGSISGTVDHLDMDFLYAGGGDTQSWPQAGSATAYFAGSIDDIALYHHTIGGAAAAAHYEARSGGREMITATSAQDNRPIATIGYDLAADRVSTLTDQDGALWTVAAPTADDGVRTVALHSTELGVDSTFHYDLERAGRIVSVDRNSGSQTWSYVEDATGGLQTTLTDENGNTVTEKADARGRVASRTTCQSASVCGTAYYTYVNATDPLDPRADLLLTSADPRSSSATDARFRTSYTYTPAGQLATTTAPVPAGQSANPVTREDYTDGTEAAIGGGTEPAGLLEAVTDARGLVTSYGYTAAGDLAATVTPTGLHLRYGYDALGRITSIATSGSTGNAFGTRTFTYNARSQVATITDPPVRNPLTTVTHQLVVSAEYDLDGNVTKVTSSDATGGDPARVASYRYDDRGRLASVTNPDGGADIRSYNSAGDLTRYTDVRGNGWVYDYNGQHQRIRVRMAGARPTDFPPIIETRAYDPGGRLASVTDAMGRTTTYSYDYSDNLTGIHLDASGLTPPPTPAVTALEERGYDLANHLTRRTAQGGAVTTYSYDNAGNLSGSVLDPGGLARRHTLTRDLAGNLLTDSLTGPSDPGRTELTEYAYAPDNQVSSTTVHNDAGAAAELVTAASYDERGLLSALTDPNGNRTDYAYDATGAQVSVTGPAVDTWVNGTRSAGVRPASTTGRNTFGEPTGARDPDGNTATAVVDAMGRVTEQHLPTYQQPGVSGPVNAVSTMDYDHAGNVVREADPLNRVTTYEYDRFGMLTKQTEPSIGTVPTVTTYGYDDDHELTSTTDPTGAVNQYTYDAFGRLATGTAVERKPGPTLNYTTRYGYDTAGNLASVTSPENHQSTAQYNKAGEQVSFTDPTQRTWTTGYDIGGRISQQKEPGGLLTDTGYDLAGRPTATIQFDGSDAPGSAVLRHEDRFFDPNGNLTGVTSPANRSVSYGYDAANRLVTQQERVDLHRVINTQLGYDADGNQTRFVDGNGNATAYTYMPWSLPESTVDPATAANPSDRTWTTRYDAAGQAVAVTEPGGVSRTSSYDALGRLTLEQGSGAEAATANRTLGYDATGRVTSIGTPGGTTTYGYDDRGNQLSAAGPSGNATLSWNGDGTLAGRTDDLGGDTFGYDAAGRLASMDGRSYGYDASGRLTSIVENLRPGSPPGSTPPTRTIGRDVFGRVSTDLGLTYGYDLDDKITSVTKSGANPDQYGYDGAGRLTSWTAPSGTVTAYGWDGAGNRTSAGGTTYTYNERNQLTSGGGTARTYTPRGTLRTIGGRTLGFDAFDRLTGDGATRYDYDSLDRLYSRNGTSRTYYDDLAGNSRQDLALGRVDYEPDGTPATYSTQAFSGEPPIGGPPPAFKTARIGLNPHGDVISTYNGDGFGGTRSYDPFGAVTATTGGSGALPALGFQGDLTEPSGLVDMAARWYDPGTGTFTSRDTMTVPPTPSAGANRYAYGNGDPIDNADPTGHYAKCKPSQSWWTCVAEELFATSAKTAAKRNAISTVVQVLWPDNLSYDPCEEQGSGACDRKYGLDFDLYAGGPEDDSEWRFMTRCHIRACYSFDDPDGSSGPGQGGGRHRPYRHACWGCPPPPPPCYSLVCHAIPRPKPGTLAGVHVPTVRPASDPRTKVNNTAAKASAKVRKITRGDETADLNAPVAAGGSGQEPPIDLPDAGPDECDDAEADLGHTNSKNYRGTFFGANPDQNGQVFVHHAIEQQVLKRYPGLFSPEELHSLENLRGIPRAINNRFHLSILRRAWNAFYRTYANPTRQQVQDYTSRIDRRYGRHFEPNLCEDDEEQLLPG